MELVVVAVVGGILPESVEVAAGGMVALAVAIPSVAAEPLSSQIPPWSRSRRPRSKMPPIFKGGHLK